MVSEEKLTYVGYREGVDPRLLTLGSLVFDFVNPRFQDPYIHEKLTPNDLDLWTINDPRSNCWVVYKTGKGCRFGGGILNLAELNSSRNNDNYHVVVASTGSKIECIKPAKFFEDVILQTDAARFWLQSRLAVSKKLKYYYGLTMRDPSIWLLTGIYMMKDATCLSVSGKSSDLGGSITAPLPDPSGIAAMLQLNPNVHWKTSSGLTVGGGSTFLGDRVWAAQYHRVGAKYVDIQDGVQFQSRQLKLLNVFDMRTSRGESTATELQVENPPNLDDDEKILSDQVEDGYWEKFGEEIRDIEEDFS
ncbi:hypothetical protein MMC26_002758 [Xylographa opegraphella]|nr:hypothetical protein [Xylographa opegraphella]